MTKSFKVGIRTNGYFAQDKMNTLLNLNDEISFSINSLSKKTNYEICQLLNILNWDKIFNELENSNKKCRISIAVNKYNAK